MILVNIKAHGASSLLLDEMEKIVFLYNPARKICTASMGLLLFCILLLTVACKKTTGSTTVEPNESPPKTLPQEKLSKDEKDLVLFGDPAEQILGAVDKNNVDLLVLGRIGYQRTNLMLRTGRTARALMGHAPCHMLVVGPSSKAPEVL